MSLNPAAANFDSPAAREPRWRGSSAVRAVHDAAAVAPSSLPKQANSHEWPGLSAWRAKGRDLRLRWGPPDAAAAPVAVSPREAPSLDSTLPPDQPRPTSLVAAGMLVLHTACPHAKAALTHAAWAAYLAHQLPLHPQAGGSGLAAEGGSGRGPAAEVAERQQPQQHGLEGTLPTHPARPERPRLVRPKEIPGHEASPLGLNGYMLHNLAHVELNAIDLAWDTVIRFSPLGLPEQFYEDFARVADDESRHLGWCLQRMAELGHSYGDMDAHNLLWVGCQRSALDLGARLAVVPMSQEARGLDAGGRLAQRLVGFGDARSAAVVALIALEERAHAAVRVAWFTRICAALDLSAGPLYRQWLLHITPELLKGPFNHQERCTVGLAREWYDWAAWPDGAGAPATGSIGAAAARPQSRGAPPLPPAPSWPTDRWRAAGADAGAAGAAGGEAAAPLEYHWIYALPKCSLV